MATPKILRCCSKTVYVYRGRASERETERERERERESRVQSPTTRRCGISAGRGEEKRRDETRRDERKRAISGALKIRRRASRCLVESAFHVLPSRCRPCGASLPRSRLRANSKILGIIFSSSYTCLPHVLFMWRSDLCTWRGPRCTYVCTAYMGRRAFARVYATEVNIQRI